MIINTPFSGKLNLDDAEYRVSNNDYIDALNVTKDAQGRGQDKVVSNILGNTLISYSLPSGVSKVIGFYGDKVRNRAKVMKEIIKDPTQSEREIAKKIWVAKTTVHNSIKDLPNVTKDDHITKVIENDAKIVSLWQKILIQRMQLAEEDPKAVSTRDVISATDLSGKRHMLLQGNVTDDNWWLKDMSTLKDMTLEQLDELRIKLKK